MRHRLSSLAILTAAAMAAPVCLAAPAAANPSACPVELSAAQHSNMIFVPVGKKQPPGSSSVDSARAQQSIDLSMKNTRLQRIVAAELEVHGTANKGRMMPASGAVLTNDSTADAVRNVHLVSSVPADQQRTRLVSVNDLTSVQWISVIELRYADGSTWHAGPGSECRVVPDGVMLIANK